MQFQRLDMQALNLTNANFVPASNQTLRRLTITFPSHSTFQRSKPDELTDSTKVIGYTWANIKERAINGIFQMNNKNKLGKKDKELLDKLIAA